MKITHTPSIHVHLRKENRGGMTRVELTEDDARLLAKSHLGGLVRDRSRVITFYPLNKADSRLLQMVKRVAKPR